MSAEKSTHDFVHQVAADWLQRLDSPDLKEDELQSWLEWFGATDVNCRAFEELQSLRERLRHAPPALSTDIRERLNISAVSRSRVPRFALAASLCAVAIATAAFWWMTQRDAAEAIYEAPSNQHRTVALEDGSMVVLGADAAVTVNYSADRRSLDVQRGEAYFEVRRNPGRPFVVEAGNVRVTAVGTAFNVVRHSDRVAVTVTEGTVEVSSADGSSKTTRLSVGQRAVVALDGVRTTVPVAANTAVAGWQEGRADFVNAPLSEVLEFVNRYTAAPLLVDDPRVADLTYSGTILRDHLDEWVASLPRVYAIRTVPLEDGSITLVMR